MARPGDIISPEEVERQLTNLRALRGERLERAGDVAKFNDLIADIMNQLEVLYIAVNSNGTKPQASIPDGFYPSSPTSREPK